MKFLAKTLMSWNGSYFDNPLMDLILFLHMEGPMVYFHFFLEY